MATAPAPGGGGGSLLSRIPWWGWGLLALAGYLAYRLMTGQSLNPFASSTTSTTQPTPDQEDYSAGFDQLAAAQGQQGGLLTKLQSGLGTKASSKYVAGLKSEMDSRFNAAESEEKFLQEEITKLQTDVHSSNPNLGTGTAGQDRVQEAGATPSGAPAATAATAGQMLPARTPPAAGGTGTHSRPATPGTEPAHAAAGHPTARGVPSSASARSSAPRKSQPQHRA